MPKASSRSDLSVGVHETMSPSRILCRSRSEIWSSRNISSAGGSAEASRTGPHNTTPTQRLTRARVARRQLTTHRGGRGNRTGLVFLMSWIPLLDFPSGVGARYHKALYVNCRKAYPERLQKSTGALKGLERGFWTA